MADLQAVPHGALAEVEAPRHSALVRITHWITFLAFLALLLTGIEILISHPPARVFAGVLYVAFGFLSGHFRRRLLPARGERSPRAFATAVLGHCGSHG
jgi:hypothetical protein